MEYAWNKKRGGNRLLLFLAVLSAVLCMTAGTANAWWNDKWEVRKKIILDTTEAGANIASTLTDVPVCIRLHSGNLYFQAVKQDGTDIRFVAGDDLTPLKHEFEWFDAVDEVAIAWVRVPRLSGNSKQDFIWMYYGNKDAAKGEDAKGVYDKNQMAVFHFGEAQGPPRDSTAYANNAASFTGAQGLPAILGKGLSMNGAQDRLIIQSTPALDLAGGFTFSAWVKMASAQANDGVLFSRANGEGAIEVGINRTRLYCRVNSGKDETLMTSPDAEVKAGDWHHVAVTAEHKGKLALFIDGVKVYGVDLSSVQPNLNSDIGVGNIVEGGKGYAGELDEVEIANTARTEDWIKAAFAGQIPQSRLCGFQTEELYSGGGSMALAYIAVIIKNITPAGWGIIAITLAILAWCVVIFVDKVITLRGIKKGHKAFEEAVSGAADLFSLNLPDDFRSSPLARIHEQGCDFMRQRLLDRNGRKYLPPQAHGSFLFELHRAAVRENQELSGKLVVMTIGISGGPFLGLFGTVWGVMETFAAMAMVGEANIMAIAPGVASALACTVVGLFLAIPALFGYNFITTQIKDVMADINLFIDRFGANVEENYGAEALSIEEESGKGGQPS